MSMLLLMEDSFLPYDLFRANEQGIWLDPSDFSTLFQDASGTTPVTALGQPVGLALDKRLGLVLGAENITNGSFDSGTSGWAAYAAATISVVANELQVNVTGASGGFSENQTLSNVLAGKWYELSFDVRLGTYSGNLDVFVNGVLAAGGISATSTRTRKTVKFLSPITDPPIRITRSTAATGTVYFDNISVRELAGNHAYQTTAASRPTVESRVNLFTKSEQLDNAAWSKAAGTISANSTTAPDGTLTADLFTEDTNNAPHYVLQNAVSGTGRATLTFHVKPNGRTRVFIRSELPQTTGLSAKFDLTGSGSVVSGTGTITALANGWYRCTATSTGNGNGASGYHLIQTLGPADADTYTGDGVSGIYVWGAQLENGTAFTTYQKVNTATDYVDVGAPRYLSFDGTDDGMATPSIDFTGTDKMTVWAVVRKLSDAATGMLAELSATTASNAGSLFMAAPIAGAAGFRYESKGTVIASASASLATYAAPITAIVTGISDISGDVSRLRINGVMVSDTTTDQGTGNYGNYPLYIGRRGGTTLPANMRLYQLIVRGAASNAGQIAATEAYVNAKTRAY